VHEILEILPQPCSKMLVEDDLIKNQAMFVKKFAGKVRAKV
jgi:hypothetical protein